MLDSSIYASAVKSLSSAAGTSSLPPSNLVASHGETAVESLPIAVTKALAFSSALIFSAIASAFNKAVVPVTSIALSATSTVISVASALATIATVISFPALPAVLASTFKALKSLLAFSAGCSAVGLSTFIALSAVVTVTGTYLAFGFLAFVILSFSST